MAGNNFFITGMPRSGTTLIDKLLSSHPQVTAYSQPLPLLFSRVKGIFLDEIGLPYSYPLADMQAENFYEAADWLSFLENFVITESLGRDVLESMIGYSGQYTKPEAPFAVLERLRPSTLAEFTRQYLRSISSSQLGVIGFKETWCEEYIPYFLRQGFQVILVIRDIRDVLCSLNYGKGVDFAGRRKPLLYNIRAWRKSVAFAFAIAEAEQVLILKYEDLVQEPGRILPKMFEFLGVDEADSEVFSSRILDQRGRSWVSNSSHDSYVTISSASVGRFKSLLPESERSIVEACSFAELKSLGYKTDVGADGVRSVMEAYKDSEVLERPELQSYCWSDARREEELARWRGLQSGEFSPHQFISAAAFSVLRKAVEPVHLGRPS